MAEPRPAPELVAILGSGSVVLFASSGWGELLGRPAIELHGRRLGDLVAAGRLPADTDDAALDVLPSRLALRGEGGRLAWIQLMLVEPIEQPQGRAVMIVAREEVAPGTDPATRLAFTDRLTSMGTLAAGFVHDLNNMFTYIVVNLLTVQRDLHTLSMSAGLDARLSKARQALADVQKSVEHVAELGRDLKGFSIAEPEILTHVDLRRVLTTALRLTVHELRARARVVEEYFDPPPVRGVEVALCQVLVNLLLNAAQAIPEGSRVTEHEIRVSARTSPQGDAIVEVRDTGSGMTPEVLGSLFTPFFTTKPPGIGTGLGLWMVHRAVTRFGGEVTVESQVDRGTTFRIRLPAWRTDPT